MEVEWPVTYHGTERDNANSIARKGYDLSKCHQFAYGKGIYSTPFVEVVEAKFNFKGKVQSCFSESCMSSRTHCYSW